MRADWQHEPLAEVCQFLNGLWKGEKPPFVEIPVIRNTNFTKEGVLDDSDIAHIPVEAKQFEKRRLEYGDVILEKSGGGPKQPVGRVVLFDKRDGAFSFSNFTSALRIRDRNRIDPRFLHKFLHWTYTAGVTENMQSHSTGIRNLDTAAYKAIEVPIPPLPEQRRIVAILDKAFAAIATAKANTEKNLQNARDLFDSQLETALAQRGKESSRLTLQTLLDKGWIEGHLDGNHGSDYPRKEEFLDHGVPYISANCIADEQVNLELAKYLSTERAARIHKGVAKDGDVLFAHNATVGPVAILRTDHEKVILGTSLTYYRCNPAQILPEYLAHYMRSRAFKCQYENVMRQSTRNQVPITKQREFYHVIPPLPDQEALVYQLDALLDTLRHLDAVYRSKLDALNALKSALLQKAFTGAL